MRLRLTALALVMLASAAHALAGQTRIVGPGGKYPSLEAANKAARPGDTIAVMPKPGGYEKVAVYVTKPRLTFRAVLRGGAKSIKLSGKGFDYSGRGSVPRAIFQINRGADGVVIDGFELTEASNSSHNGAGVRVNEANAVTVRNCHIHGNNMGIMSNGDGKLGTMRNLVIEHCRVNSNGDARDPGYNHNFYLGGTSVVLQFCEIYGALTGHNVKSRAHFNTIRYCYIHDSANREFDLVDAADTEFPNSNTLLLGNVIVKKRNMKGNKAVLHFGRDGKRGHDGTLYLINNTVVTHYGRSGWLQVSAKKAKVELWNNIVVCTDKSLRSPLIIARSGGAPAPVTGRNNWFSGGYKISDTSLKPTENILAKRSAANPGFADLAGADVRPIRQGAQEVINRGWPKVVFKDGGGKEQPGQPKHHYIHPLKSEERPSDGKPDMGAYELKRR